MRQTPTRSNIDTSLTPNSPRPLRTSKSQQISELNSFLQIKVSKFYDRFKRTQETEFLFATGAPDDVYSFREAVDRGYASPTTFKQSKSSGRGQDGLPVRGTFEASTNNLKPTPRPPLRCLSRDNLIIATAVPKVNSESTLRSEPPVEKSTKFNVMRMSPESEELQSDSSSKPTGAESIASTPALLRRCTLSSEMGFEDESPVLPNTVVGSYSCHGIDRDLAKSAHCHPLTSVITV